MIKKITACAAALACAVSCAAYVFGAELENGAPVAVTSGKNNIFKPTYKIEAEALVYEPTLNVTIPGSANVTLNPYRIEAESEEMGDVRDMVISPAQTIENHSNCGISIVVSSMVFCPHGSEVITLVSAPDTGGGTEPLKPGTTKKAYLYMAASLNKSDVTSYQWYDWYRTAPEGLVCKRLNHFREEKILTIPMNGSGYTKIGGYVNGNTRFEWTDLDTVEIELIYTIYPAPNET